MSISLEQVSKHYGSAAAVNDVSVEIAEGEFFVLLGPSGSGKSTLLRAIAGLTSIDHGRVMLFGRDVTHIRPRDREVGFVFQNYALFRHMTVGDNVEFALRARKVRTGERRRRRKELLKLVSLEGLDDRLPSELSGGQQQRVAVARALAHQPRVLLLDEPFGALDARIREDLRRAIREIQRTVGITTILVTHDQEEAFAMADRIGVMDRGRLHECGEPRALYESPRTRFVATFLGSANLLLGRYESDGVRIGRTLFELEQWPQRTTPGAEATTVIRPEDIVLRRQGRYPEPNPIGTGIITELGFIGALERLRFSVTTDHDLVSARQPGIDSFLMEALRSARESHLLPLQVGDRVDFGARQLHVLPTPFNSLRLFAQTATEIAELAGSSLVRELSEHTHIEPTRHRDDTDSRHLPVQGTLVTPFNRAAGLAPAANLLERGAAQVIALSDPARQIERVLIYIQPSRAARDAGLGVAGSLLRQLSVDAALLVPAGERYGGVYRGLLDVRSAALRQYGVDVRTESFREPIADALRTRLTTSDASTLLLIGLTSAATGTVLIDELTALVANCPNATAVLLAGGRSETPTAVGTPLTDNRTNRVAL